MDISDAIWILAFLFQGSRDSRCLDAMDADADGVVMITDAIVVLQHLFLGGAPPSAPFPNCDVDPDPRNERLNCKEFACKI